MVWFVGGVRVERGMKTLIFHVTLLLSRVCYVSRPPATQSFRGTAMR